MYWIQFNSIDKDDETHTFYYTKTKEIRLAKVEYTCFVSKRPEILPEGCFEAAVEVIDDNSVKIVMLNNNSLNDYSARGIPDALIPLISIDLGVDVISSSNKYSDTSERREPSATKFWKRLVRQGLAIYDKYEDRYKFHNII